MLKKGDVVFFKHRKVIGNERLPQAFIDLNRIYSVNDVGVRLGEKFVTLYGNGSYFRPEHFIKVTSDEVQGKNVFPIGSIVEYVAGEQLPWEVTYYDGIESAKKLKVGDYYEVVDYLLHVGEPYMKVMNNGATAFFDSSHFKKVL